MQVRKITKWVAVQSGAHFTSLDINRNSSAKEVGEQSHVLYTVVPPVLFLIATLNPSSCQMLLPEEYAIGIIFETCVTKDTVLMSQDLL